MDSYTVARLFQLEGFMPVSLTIDDVAKWTQQQGDYINSLSICVQFGIPKRLGAQFIRALITHPRIVAENRREHCINSSGGRSTMLMVHVINISPPPFGPPKPLKPPHKNEIYHQKLKKLNAIMHTLK